MFSSDKVATNLFIIFQLIFLLTFEKIVMLCSLSSSLFSVALNLCISEASHLKFSPIINYFSSYNLYALYLNAWFFGSNISCIFFFCEFGLL